MSRVLFVLFMLIGVGSHAMPVRISGFELDRYPVTRAQFLSFVRRHPEWRRSRAQALFIDSEYLRSWRSDLEPGDRLGKSDAPVTEVTWYAAQAYCEAQGERLPSTDEWEYAARDQGRTPAQNLKSELAWYSRPATSRLPSVRKTMSNGFGVNGLLGVIWEWTEDFDSSRLSATAKSVDEGAAENFCGGAVLAGLNPADYAAYLRASFRDGLRARFSTTSLGFRCARNEEGR